MPLLLGLLSWILIGLAGLGALFVYAKSIALRLPYIPVTRVEN